MSKDENCIPFLLQILQNERSAKKELVEDLNLMVSKLHTCIDEPTVGAKLFKDKTVNDFVKPLYDVARNYITLL